MQTEAGDYVDKLMYTPRKCSVTNRIISANDHASVQINIGDIDESGRFTGNSKTYAFCGFLRQQVTMTAANQKECVSFIPWVLYNLMGEADDALVQIAIRDGLIPKAYKP